MITLKKKKMTKRLSAAVLSLVIILYQLVGTAPFTLGLTAFAAEATTNIPLRRLNGSGKAFIYHSFNETTKFTAGNTYAFLDGIYSADDAVSALGAGAILKILSKEPSGAKYGSEYYIQKKYGSDAAVKAYVAVETPGKDFDFCPNGGLYQVPNTANPTEYRYFCWKGGAYNCGPYYAYTYVEESVVSDNVTASLKNIENQGSQNSKDYTVTVTYDGNKKKVLDHGSYKVKFTSPDKVTIIVSDSVGNSITANFQSPLAVRYDGNCENALNVPSAQTAWKGESNKLSSALPTRLGYSFVNWKDSNTGKTYSAGQSFTPESSLRLLAQWKDSQAPVIGYTPTQVMTGDSDETVKKAVLEVLTVTDNEPVSECTITVTLPAGFTKTAGTKNAKVTVKDKAGNTSTKACSVYVSSYVDISKPVFTASSKNLTATLNNPGTDKITESGFVWGVMNSPSLKINNGNEKTATAVSNAGGKISVTASNLQKGVTYYARAYITADNITYYSEEITIGLGLPAYGTFTVKNNGDNTFTIIRSGGTEGQQLVYFRTVNGSAVGGTHFTHTFGYWTFKDGETSKKVTVTEKSANTAYTGKSATAYSNADRTYSLEIYRVDGGGSLDDDQDKIKAKRTMKNTSSYKVDRSVYNETKGTTVSVDNEKKYVVDRSGGSKGDLYWKNNRGYNTKYNQDNFNTNFNVSSIHKSSAAYIKATAQTYLYRYTMNVTEEEDCYEQAWMGTHEPDNAHSDKKCAGDYTKKPVSLTDKNAGSAIWTAVFLAAQGYKNITKNFPSTSIDKSEDKGSLSNKVYACNSSNAIVSEDGKTYAKIPIADTVYNFFAATGSDEDRWRVENFTDYIKICDSVEPQLIAVGPMAGGTYKIGDKFTVSLIFDEIVDSRNSTNIKNVKVNTTWGTADYAGGADTNVIYFTGTVAENASEKLLKVNSITNPNYIKDMCNSTTTKATASKSGTTNAELDASVPNFTVTANGITNGTGKATVTVNADKTKTNKMSYAWSDSSTAPTSGWVELSDSELSSAKSTSGLSLSIRKEAGSGKSNGKWYLHVKAVYSTTGASAYKNACLDFGTAASPALGSKPPTLTAKADNTNWAASRNISISATGAQSLKYRKSDAASWTTLSTTATGVTVYKNGYYTFLLSSGDVTVTKTVSVEKIDRESPTASIGEPTSNSKESPKSGVYTKIELPITYADTGSGVKTVHYKWTNSTAAPSSWLTLVTGKTTVTYTASESTATVKYLHIKVSDNVNYTCTTYSSPFKVISEAAVKNHTPTITVTGAPTKWTNDTATLTWQLSKYAGKNYEVILPDGKKSSETSGEVWARQNGDYTVTVRDLDYGGENSASVTVDKLDFTSPAVTVSGGNDGWTNTDQTLTISASDTQSGVGKKWYKIVSSTDEIPTEGLTELTGNTIKLSEEGRYYLYYKIYDNAGDTELDREANKTEGFKAVLIDKTAPAVSIGEYSANAGITVTAADITSKLASLSYRIGNGAEIPITLTNGQIEKVFTITDLPAGNNEITVTATDNSGLCTTIVKKVHVEIVSVEITWGAMEFTYSEGTWNAKAHTYEGVGWEPDKTDGNKIAVRNSGETAVNVSYSYTPANSAVMGGITDKVSMITAPIALNASEEKSAWLILNGKPNKTINKDILGSVTVTLGGN